MFSNPSSGGQQFGDLEPKIRIAAWRAEAAFRDDGRREILWVTRVRAVDEFSQVIPAVPIGVGRKWIGPQLLLEFVIQAIFVRIQSYG